MALLSFWKSGELKAEDSTRLSLALRRLTCEKAGVNKPSWSYQTIDGVDVRTSRIVSGKFFSCNADDKTHAIPIRDALLKAGISYTLLRCDDHQIMAVAPKDIIAYCKKHRQEPGFASSSQPGDSGFPDTEIGGPITHPMGYVDSVPPPEVTHPATQALEKLAKHPELEGYEIKWDYHSDPDPQRCNFSTIHYPECIKKISAELKHRNIRSVIYPIGDEGHQMLLIPETETLLDALSLTPKTKITAPFPTGARVQTNLPPTHSLRFQK